MRHLKTIPEILAHDPVEPGTIVLPSGGTVEVRPYQLRLLRQTLEAVEAGHQAILIESPTGSGKTIIAHLIIWALREWLGWEHSWTCTRRALVEQAANVNEDLFRFPGRYFTTFSPPEDCASDILIEDEAQHSACATATTLASVVQPKLHLALTATPWRSDQAKLAFSKVLKDAGLRALVDGGYLSPYQLYRLPGAWTAETVTAAYLDSPWRWGRSIFYLHRVADCRKACDILRARGVRAEAMTGEMSPAAVDDLLVRFDSGAIDVLVNVQMLTEGFDCPALETVFVRNAGKGPTMQMAGRVFRRHPEIPVKKVVQSAASATPFHELVEPIEIHDQFEGKWEPCRRDVDRVEDIRIEMNRKLLAAKPVELPGRLSGKNNKGMLSVFPEQSQENHREFHADLRGSRRRRR